MSQLRNDNITDNDLIEGCIRDDRHFQQLLYNKYSAKMYGVCLRYTDNLDDAQDVLQEGFIKAFKNLTKFRSEGSFEGWLRRIFVNTSIEHYRKRKYITRVTNQHDEQIEDEDINVLHKLAERDILAIINELSPGYKTVFNLHVIEGYSHKEIAEMLGINEGTSKSQLARAKSVLKKVLENTKLVEKNQKENG